MSFYTKHKEFFLNIFALALCMSVVLVGIDRKDIPISLHDEFGYWGNAAYFADYGWDSIMSNCPMYAWGYSLVLVPLLIYARG